MQIQVIGAGLGRTGTMSLKLALERLGFGPCYHMKELMGHLDTDVDAWSRAADGEYVEWEELFRDYASAVDHPAAVFYRELARHYPDAKVVLTVRDPERWFESFSQTIMQPMTEPLPDRLKAWGRMHEKVIAERIFGGRIGKDSMIAAYERHNAEVKRTISPERLLVYEVAQGWGPLCRFLDVAVPDEPFPVTNSTEEFRIHLAPLFGRAPAA